MNAAALARAAAVLIAVAGVIDPALATRRSARPEIAVVDAGTGDRDLLDRVAAALSSRFEVMTGAWPGAAAMVVAGARVPDAARHWNGPAFVVAPKAPVIRILSASAPRSAPVESKVPVAISIATNGLDGRRVEVSITHQGHVVDSTTIDVAADASAHDLTLSYVPTREGAVTLGVAARVVDSAEASATPLAIDVTHRQWRVLFVDARPSWSSTFVRRAIEHDPRFDVASRVATSRSVSAATADAPARLDDAAALARFDAVVASASAELSPADVGHLEHFARTRAGTLVLLLEARPGGAIQALIGARNWQTRTTTEPATLTARAPSRPTLAAAELAWPSIAPPMATPLLSFAPAGGAAPAPVIWQAPLGDGAVIVSAAFDAWRWRAAEGSTFDAFWRETIAAAAARAPAPVEVEIVDPVVRPGDTTIVRVAARDLAAAATTVAAAHATASATMTAADGSSEEILLVPTAPGRFEGRWRATSIEGVHRLTATVNDVRGSAIALVSAAATFTPTAPERLTAWATAREGRVFAETELERLSAALVDRLAPAREDVRWHPMRSPWWIVPFAALAGFEWMQRRKRSLI